jgi:hypothetical protein
VNVREAILGRTIKFWPLLFLKLTGNSHLDRADREKPAGAVSAGFKVVADPELPFPMYFMPISA